METNLGSDMNSRQLVKTALGGGRTDRPLFCPAIYEHKAGLVGKSPSEVSQSSAFLEQSVLAEYETYSPDMLTVGIDIYNVEAEALGSEVLSPSAADAVPVIKKRILARAAEFDKLDAVEPENSGRMPLVLEAASKVNDKLGRGVYVRGAISAPYSIAVQLMGIEPLIIAMLDEPDEVAKLLSFCTDVSIAYGTAFVSRGVEVCVFDSYVAPPLLSPRLFEDMILGHVGRLIAELRRCGAEFVEYVIGGRTAPIAPYLFKSGADIILSDFISDVSIFLELAKGTDVLIRRNINPVLIEQGSEHELRRQVEAVLKLWASHPNVMVGTGVISYNTSVEKVLSVKKMCLEGCSRTG